MARTQEERKAETRGRLIEAAAELFARRGFDGVSAESVCDAAGRTTGSLYSHFGGKEGLLVALLDEWRDSTAAAVSAEIDEAAPVEDRLRALWRNFTATEGPPVESGGPGEEARQRRAGPPVESGGPGEEARQRRAGPPVEWILLEHELWLQAARDGSIRGAVEDRYATGRAGLGRMANDWADEAGADTGLRARQSGALVLALLLGLEMQRRLAPEAVPDDLAVAGLQRLLKMNQTKRSN